MLPISLTNFFHRLSVTYSNRDLQFSGLCNDSRQLVKGEIFFDFTGSMAHIQDAIRKGASAIITSNTPWDEVIPTVTHDNPRLLFAKACALYFGAQPSYIASVTGTNGKSSTVDFVRQLWSSFQFKAASVGTLGVVGTDLSFTLPSLTTLDACRLHKVLSHLFQQEINHVAFEASSHGLHQHRLDGVKIRYAGFTNLTQDHLDYHNTMEEYFQAKSRLFLELLDPKGVAVINQDDDYGQELINTLRAKGCRVITYSLENQKADLFARIDAIDEKGLKLEVTAYSEKITVDVSAIGLFQVANILCALGLVLASVSISLKGIKPALEALKTPKGRMEYIGTTGKGGHVYIDYAHTPDALQNALQSIRAHTSGKLHVIFGCGGDRDRTKRPLMGAIASKWADKVIITDDNPRTEDAAFIRSQVSQGNANERIIGDRAEAIRAGIEALGKGDILLIAGKGHEQGQIIDDRTFPFCDRLESEKCMADMPRSHSCVA